MDVIISTVHLVCLCRFSSCVAMTVVCETKVIFLQRKHHFHLQVFPLKRKSHETTHYGGCYTCALFWPHLVLLPGPEEVDRAVLPPLDDCPASLSATLLAPGLQQAVGALRSEQVDAAGALPRVQHVLTVPPRACGRRTHSVRKRKP